MARTARRRDLPPSPGDSPQGGSPGAVSRTFVAHGAEEADMAQGQDDARSSKYLMIAGVMPLHPFQIDALKSESALAERPDRTKRATDQKTPQTFTARWKSRDKAEIAFLKNWRSLREHLPVTLTYLTEDEQPIMTGQLVACCPYSIEVSQLSSKDDAEEVTITVGFTTDDYVILDLVNLLL